MKSLHEWKFWDRHKNYLSGWTRLAAYPLLLSSLYFRDWNVVAGVIIFIIVNPVLFPAPNSHEYWMSKGVLGEQLWIKNKKKLKKANFLNMLNAVSVILFAVFAYYQLLYPAIVSGTASAFFKLLFMEEMVLYYKKEKSQSNK